MAKLILLLGGNMGDRFFFLSKANELLHRELGRIVRKSSFYETEAWGFQTEHSFLNQAIEIDTDKTPKEVLQVTQKIEQKLGRIRMNGAQGYESRNIDIDIIFYDDCVMQTPVLNIPHAHMHERRFVLEPLNEICPEYMHPMLNMKVACLLAVCTDRHKVKHMVKCTFA